VSTKPSLRRSLFVSVAALSLTCILCISGAFFYVEYYYFQQEEQRMRSEYMTSQKNILRSEVDRIVDYIYYMKWRTDRRLRESNKEHVHEAHAVATSLYNRYKDTRSRKEIGEMIKAALRSVRYNDGRGYYFIADLKGTLLLQPINVEAEGQDYSDWKDEDGVYIFKTAIDIVTRYGQGSFSYRWLKPGIPDKQFKKISYVKLFKPLDWYIGTGEYVEDVARDIQAEALARLEKIRFGDNGYFFVGQWDGLSLAGPAKGKVMWDVTGKNGVKVVQELVEASKHGGGFVEYVMPKVNDSADLRKLSYARGVDDWEWYVGAGVILDDIEARILIKQDELYDRLYQHVILFTFLFLALAGGIFIVSGRLSGRLGATVRDFLAFFDAAREGRASIDPEAQYYREFSNIARAANEMIERRESTEAELGMSEKRFKLLFNTINDAIFVYRIAPDGERGTFFEFNNAACEQLEYSCEELESMKVEDIDVGSSLDSIEKRFGTDGFSIFETIHRAKSGRVFPVEVYARLFELGGQPTVMVICRDITDRKATGEELQVSLEKYRALFDMFPFGITVTDEQGDILEVNQESERLLGVSTENHTERNLDSEEWKIVGPDGEELPYQEFPASIALAESRIVRDHEIGVVKSGEETAWLSVTAAPIPIEGYGVVVGYTDVTARRQAEAELARKNALFNAVLDQISSAFFICEGNAEKWFVSYANKEAEIITGVSRGDINRLGFENGQAVHSELKTWKTGIPGDKKASFESAPLPLAMSQGIATKNKEMVVTRADGLESVVLVNAAPIFDNKEQHIAGVIAYTDISERAMAEKALRKSEDHLAGLFKTMPTGLFVLEDRKIQDVNDQLCDIFGYTRKEMIGQSTRLLYHSDDDFRKYGELVYGQIRENGVSRLEAGMRHKSGRNIQMFANSTRLVSRDKSSAIISTLLDITERKKAEQNLQESEAKFRRLVEDLGDRFCLFQHDLEGNVTYLSPSAQSMLGVDVEKTVGESWRVALDWEEGAVARAEEHIALLVRGDVSTVTYELPYTHPAGSVHTLEITEHLLEDEDQNIIGVEGIIVDVTERARSEEELKEYGDKLEEMVHERTTELTSIVDELQVRNEESSAMARFGDLLQVCETDEESYGIIAAICTQLFTGHSGYLALLDESTKSLVAVSGFGDFDWQDVEFDIQDCWALRRGRPHIISDPKLDPPCPHMGENPTDASICMPVEARGEYLGLLHVRLNLIVELTEEQRQHRINGERDLARRVGELYSLSLANIRLREKLRVQSIRDALTGLYNRRHMEESLTREIDRARRKETSLGVILMDVDHFKKFNDTYGHEAGDEVLRKLGLFLRTHTRGEDIPCRYGGEELLLILPDCSPEDCRKRAEQVREGVEALEIMQNDTKLSVTISLGAATYPIQGKTWDDVVSAADKALYEAKEKGRNRVEMA